MKQFVSCKKCIILAKKNADLNWKDKKLFQENEAPN
jgi:hypothetical protein